MIPIVLAAGLLLLGVAIVYGLTYRPGKETPSPRHVAPPPSPHAPVPPRPAPKPEPPFGLGSDVDGRLCLGHMADGRLDEGRRGMVGYPISFDRAASQQLAIGVLRNQGAEGRGAAMAFLHETDPKTENEAVVIARKRQRGQRAPTRAQLDAVDALLARGPMETTAHARDGYLAGNVAVALERRGWARRPPGSAAYELTPAGFAIASTRACHRACLELTTETPIGILVRWIASAGFTVRSTHADAAVCEVCLAVDADTLVTSADALAELLRGHVDVAPGRVVAQYDPGHERSTLVLRVPSDELAAFGASPPGPA